MILINFILVENSGGGSWRLEVVVERWIGWGGWGGWGGWSGLAGVGRIQSGMTKIFGQGQIIRNITKYTPAWAFSDSPVSLTEMSQEAKK